MIGDLAEGRERIPTLPTRLREMLERIPASDAGYVRYHPCRVTLVDGEAVDGVYVVEAQSYIRAWGVWPWEDPGKRELVLAQVASLEESPTRLPVELANKMYAAGETAMGGCRFLLRLRDGRKLLIEAGNAVDFIEWPPGVGPGDVVDLVPHAGDEHDLVSHAADYKWCLYWGD